MIDRVHFENFKSLQDVTIQLGRLTVLVGANGCGKSSVLQGMFELSKNMTTADQAPRPFSAALGYRGRAPSIRIALYSTTGEEFSLETRFTEGRVQAIEPRLPDPSMTSVERLCLDANMMSRTSVIENEIPTIAWNGFGLASALAWLKGAAEDEFAEITRHLRQVVPGVKRIRTLRELVSHQRMDKIAVDGQPVWRPVEEKLLGDRFTLEFDDGSEIPGNMLSEGTVLALGLITKLHEPSRPNLLLIDDVDRGLHLGAQVSLLKVLREILGLAPNLQIVCTTHSPYLLDLFTPDEVRVLALDAERRTHVRPLTEHPDFGKWKFGTQTGELWAALGEDWVLSGAAG